MGVKVTFKVGNHSRLKAPAEYGVEQFMYALGDDVAKKAENAASVDVHALTNNLSGRVERSLQAAMNFAASNLIGIPSANRTDTRGGTIQPTRITFDWDEPINPLTNPGRNVGEESGLLLGKQETIQWLPLKSGTLKRKAAKGGRGRQERARQHFVDTGSLRSELKALAKIIANKTGTVKVGYIKRSAKSFNAYRSKQKTVKVGQLQITFAPKIPLRTLPGIASGSVSDFNSNMMFERSLGISTESLKKLKGPEFPTFTHRPLLQPVFTYWLLNRVPHLLAGTIDRAIRSS